MHQALQGATFHIEHVIPKCLGGASVMENLAWACPGCNLSKSGRIEAIDPQLQQPVPLFSPRKDRWADHFYWSDYEVRPRTAIGRVTIAALNLNHPRRIRIRMAEESFDLFPPDEV